jgi:mannose-6-phosphate isomerase-like protein (cupin superfamily)
METIANQNYTKSSEELYDTLKSQIKNQKPSFFRLRAQLPNQGRTDTPLASSEKLWVVLKTYASDGENELHAHPNEDHVFVVMQGKGTFYGPGGEENTIGLHEGVMLPHGTFYSFKATSTEPLVMLRVGCTAKDGASRHGRVRVDGTPMAGFSDENKHVELVLSDDWFG